jgi:hypothetical protein
MELYDLYADGYGRILSSLERQLPGLSGADLHWQPTPASNSIAWLAWHISRVPDYHVSDLIGETQIYIRDGWHTRFGRPAGPRDIGTGHTPEQVAAFRAPDVETLLDYHRAVLGRNLDYIRTLSAADLDRELDEPQYTPLPTVGVRLISVLHDGLAHAGQIGYLKGLLKARDA